MKPSICIDAVFEGCPTVEAIDRVAACGYEAIEFWAWWEKDLDELMKRCDALNLSIAACCTRFVSLVDPQRRGDYLDGLRESIAAAQRLKCPTLISQVGDFRPGIERVEQQRVMVQGLTEAARLLEDSGVTLAIEPLNDKRDHPGYYLVSSLEGFEILRQVGSPHVKMTFDIYHQQISEGDLLENLLPNIDQVAHLHAAGNPGRHELDAGEINYPQIIHAIKHSAFDGYFGLEYWPLEFPETSLKRYRDWF